MARDFSELPFMVETAGRFGPGQVTMQWRDEPRPSLPELEELITRTWHDQMVLAEAAGRTLYNGRLARLLRWRVEGGGLHMVVGPTDYAAFMATHLLNPHRGDEFGWETFAHPVGTSATVITTDGCLLYGRRNQQVAFHQDYVHTFGGGIEAREKAVDGSIDVFASIRRELCEELRIAPQDVTELVCLGMIRDRTIRQPELVFDATVRQTREELANRIDPTSHEEEHAEILACRDDPEAVIRFIGQTAPIAPVAVGSMLLHGRNRYGEQWYEAAPKLLAR